MDHLTHFHPFSDSEVKFPLVYRRLIYYDKGEFDTFYQRASDGVEFDPSSVAGDLDSHADVLQAWLFFGLLHECSSIFYVPIILSDFIRVDSGGEDTLTTQPLTKHIWCWAASLAHAPERFRPLRRFRLHKVLQLAISAAEEISLLEKAPGHPVLVPIFALIDTIHSFAVHFCDDVGTTAELGEPAPISDLRGAPIILRTWLEEKGWCPGEVSFLLWRGLSTSTLFLLASKDKYLDWRDHTKCQSFKCNANQIDDATYETQHMRPGCDCDFLPGDGVIEDIERIVESGGIPTILVSSRKEGGTRKRHVEIFAETFQDPDEPLSHSFVAISHVWSDGMGNAKRNALPTCVLRHIKNRVQRLYPGKDHLVPFWIDTLCVPLRPDLRKKAISGMKDVYSLADKTLVIDHRLHSLAASNASIYQACLYASVCPWTSRLWTLQEALLAKSLWYDFADRPMDIVELSEKWLVGKTPTNVTSGMFEGARKQHITYAQQIDRSHQLALKLYPREFGKSASESTHEESDPCKDATPDDRRLAEWISHGDRLDTVIPDLKNSLYLLENRKGTQNEQFCDVFGALAGRTTSRLEDEAICVASLLGKDLSPLFRVAKADRLKTLMRMIEDIPVSILFIQTPRDVQTAESTGFRWAPRSFLFGGASIPHHPLSGRVDDEGGFNVTLRGIQLRLREGIQLQTDTARLDFLITDGSPDDVRNDVECLQVTAVPVVDNSSEKVKINTLENLPWLGSPMSVVLGNSKLVHDDEMAGVMVKSIEDTVVEPLQVRYYWPVRVLAQRRKLRDVVGIIDGVAIPLKNYAWRIL